MNSTLLALETSGTRCSVALWRDEAPAPVMRATFHDGAQTHAAHLIPMVMELLAEDGLTRASIGAVAFGQGPGSFTGLRVACAVAQGMGMALDIPVVPIGGLDAVADQVPRAGVAQLVVVAMDARMSEVYASVFYLAPRETADESSDSAAAPRALTPPVLLALEDVTRWAGAQLAAFDAHAPAVHTGDAWKAYPEALVAPHTWQYVAVDRPEATAVARLGALAWREGRTIDAAEAAPLYVRDKVAFTTAERLTGAGGNPKAPQALQGAKS